MENNGSRQRGARWLKFISIVLGVISLLAFIAYPRGLVPIMPRGWRLGAVLTWDAFLSVLFFLQHSLMIRRRIRARLEALIRPEYYMAAYSVASGVVLVLVAALWQPAGIVAYSVEVPFRWIIQGFWILTMVGFAWAMFSLRPFDPFGVVPIDAWLKGGRLPEPRFSVNGAYRWVRHPLYAGFVAILWLNPAPTLDVLLGNVLWTAWIVMGTFLEERDLSQDFQNDYGEYRRRVPMFIPWRGRYPAPNGR